MRSTIWTVGTSVRVVLEVTIVPTWQVSFQRVSGSVVLEVCAYLGLHDQSDPSSTILGEAQTGHGSDSVLLCAILIRELGSCFMLRGRFSSSAVSFLKPLA